jgi:putative sterol carrier protein
MARDHVGTGVPASLVWSYDHPRDRLSQLYEDGKVAQWNAATDIDWSLEADPGSGPLFATEAGQAIDWASFGDPLTTALGTGPEARRAILTQYHAWYVSQFLHGEQGALVAMAKVCAAVDSVEAKCCAALQMADEARHVEVYRRYLDKIGITYPVSPTLRDLLGQAVRHRSADLTYVAVQVLMEGLGLATAALGEQVFGNPLLCRIIELVARDEARHLAFGAAALDGLYEQMDPVERREREDFVLEACAVMRHGFRAVPVWEHFGIDTRAAEACFADSPDVAIATSLSFARVVPELRRLGLLTPRVRDGLEALGLVPVRCWSAVSAAAGGSTLVKTTAAGDDGQRDWWDAGSSDRETGVEAGRETMGAGRWGVTDPLLALRAALGCVEQIDPGPVLLAMSGLADRARLATVPKATVRLEVSGPDGDSAWLLTVDEDRMVYRGALPADRGDVAVRMDLPTWTEMVAGRVPLPVALAAGRISVAGDIFKARALEAVL